VEKIVEMIFLNYDTGYYTEEGVKLHHIEVAREFEGLK
jgi:hypothetical protein